MLTPHKNPIDYAPHVKCSVLIQICENDNIANPQGSLNTAERLKNLASVKKYHIGHFDIYFGGNFTESIRDQINFFKKHVSLRVPLIYFAKKIVLAIQTDNNQSAKLHYVLLCTFGNSMFNARIKNKKK